MTTDRSGAQVILITGASSGFGEACARHLAGLGHAVYGTSRRAPVPGESGVAPRTTTEPRLIPMDVGDDASIRSAVAAVLEREGRIDVVINNAGVGLAGAIEEASPDEALALFETNFFGPLRVCRAVLPSMRAGGGGLIVNVGSIGGAIAIPFQGIYSASKSALASMSDALRMEVRPFGVRVALVEPGDFKTSFTSNRVYARESREGSPYYEPCRRAIAVMEKDEQNGADAEALAALIARIVADSDPRPRYRAGMLFQRLVAALRPLLPGRLFERGLALYYRL